MGIKCKDSLIPGGYLIDLANNPVVELTDSQRQSAHIQLKWLPIEKGVCYEKVVFIIGFGADLYSWL